MLTRRSLTLSDSRALPDGPVLRRETLEQSLMAGQLLEAARSEAEQILAEARSQAEQLAQEARAQAGAQIWRQADALFSEWQAQREQMWEQITGNAQTLVTRTLECLLGELEPQERIAALLRQIAAAHPREDVGTLHCHPQDLAEVDRQVQSAQAVWSVRADAQLPRDSLCLRTTLGDFSLSWNALVSHVWPLPTTPQQ
ncbi:type III secretion system stator protein SctL [Pseudomonas baetica]|uniref:type III secretion system stator protein SctL n=1 Tax=Pseudomonas baetica TaxID=674054 RepID=UPI001C8CD7C2|nr:type III secretion system stator protein SctL [Pseudomonas baetica]MBX9404944.1 type III secretion system stator protein SctL [Pseudomonas baetica]